MRIGPLGPRLAPLDVPTDTRVSLTPFEGLRLLREEARSFVSVSRVQGGYRRIPVDRLVTIGVGSARYPRWMSRITATRDAREDMPQVTRCSLL